MPAEEQYIGCLVGLAVGDALGYPIEGMSLRQIREKYGPAGLGDFVSRHGHPPGSYSDDTQLTLAVAHALLEAGEQPVEELMEAMARAFVAWYKSPEMARGPGLSTLAACANLARGGPWSASGLPDAKGCGAPMRVAPIALRYFREPEKMHQVAGQSARITHAHPTAVAASVANACAVAYVLERKPPGELLDVLLSVAAPFSAEMEEALLKVRACQGAEPEAAFAELGETGSSEHVLASALFCFLRTPEDYRATVLAGINCTGDSDSIGAMAGALSGAYNGVGAIPERWARRVENGTELERVARELYAHAGKQAGD
jgi:ADP-ribosylglycohydrolase